MSHGGGGDDELDVNLTPLLDLVLQLVMFFMVVANFVMEELNAEITLPETVSVKPLDREVTNIIVVNIDKDGGVLFTGRGEAIKDRSGVFQLFRDLADDFARDDPKFDPAKKVVVIRADGRCSCEPLFWVMEGASEAKFTTHEIRANQPRKK